MAPDTPLAGPLEANRRLLRQALGRHYGATFRDLLVPAGPGRPRHALLVYIEGQVDQQRLEAYLVRPLLGGEVPLRGGLTTQFSADSRVVKSLREAAGLLLRGHVLLQIAGSADLLALTINAVPHRDISPPETETGVSGPRESFTEYLVRNLTQLRRRLPGTELQLESHWVGRAAPVQVILAYADGRPTRRMLDVLRRRLGKVKLDGIQDVAQLAEALADRPVTVFPTVLTTERPDMVIQHVMAGRIAILMENSPRALIEPALFMDFLVSPDDFYEWRPFVLFLRLLRVLAFSVAVPLPALYVSFTTYHLQALPTQLTLSLLAQREGAPLPPPIEAVIMAGLFEVLREAGLRLPRAIGPTVSIVGGLVIGEAAIRSGLTSPAMVLVVSATAVASFSLPSTSLANAATYVRFVLLALASTFGFFGLLLGYLLVLGNLAGMTSLGVPYLTPLFPLRPGHLKTAAGLKPRAPQGIGTRPPADMTGEAEAFTERED